MATLKETINDMVYKLRLFSSEVTRVSLDVGTMGQLGGQAVVTGVEGTWKTRESEISCSVRLRARRPQADRCVRDVATVTETVNTMATQLTVQIRSIAIVTSAIARGECVLFSLGLPQLRVQSLTSLSLCSLSKTIDAEVQGEMATLKETVNSMVTRLRVFSSEVTRVAKEVGTDGQLGGQAVVHGVEGTWKELVRRPFVRHAARSDSVNESGLWGIPV